MDDITAHVRAALQPFLQVSSLADLHHAYKTIPIQYPFIGHCLFLAALAPEFKNRFLVHFWITFLAGFGGSLVTSILIMDPVKAPINILANNTIGVTLFACWWLMLYSPFNIVGRLHSFPPVKMLTKLCVTFMRANLIINRVDLAVAMFPGVIAAPLILGTLAGSGGKLIVDAIRHHWTGLLGPAEASVPTFVWRSAALAAGGYWAVCKYTGYLTSQEAAALVITVLLVHSILSDLFGSDVTDFTFPVAKVVHALSLVPMPTAAAAPAAASKPAKKAVPGSQQQSVATKPQKPQPASAAAAQNGSVKPASQQQQSTTSATSKPQPAVFEAAGQKNGKNVAVKADSSSAPVKKDKKQESRKNK